MIELDATTISTSNADDLAFSALADVCTLTGDLDVRIVGGQMAHLLLCAFPSANALARRTADADAAIGTELAASGDVHELLTDAGYAAAAGNSYVKDGQQVDLLVPNRSSGFRTEVLGGRGFDAAPGIAFALALPPILIHVSVTLTGDRILRFDARVPPVEAAVTLKANAYRSRLADRDLVDLHNLLWILEERDAGAIGGWALDRAASGSRGDAQRALADILRMLSRRPTRPTLEVQPETLVALIRRHVAVPA